MKKIFTTALVACALMAAPAQAQLKFGIRGGANLSSVSLSGSLGDNLNADNRAGFYVGPTVKFTVPVVGLSFDASALYDQKSAKFVDSEDAESVTQKQIAIPVNVRYGLGLGDAANIFLFTGPQFGFNVGSDNKELGTGWTWKSSNFSWNIGVGATIASHVEAKLNYNIACGTTGEATVLNTATNAVKGKYNSWQLGLAYYF